MVCPDGMLGNDVSCGLRSENALLVVLTSWHRRWLRDTGRQKPQQALRAASSSCLIMIVLLLLLLLIIIIIIIIIDRRQALEP